MICFGRLFPFVPARLWPPSSPAFLFPMRIQQHHILSDGSGCKPLLFSLNQRFSWGDQLLAPRSCKKGELVTLRKGDRNRTESLSSFYLDFLEIWGGLFVSSPVRSMVLEPEAVLFFFPPAVPFRLKMLSCSSFGSKSNVAFRSSLA